VFDDSNLYYYRARYYDPELQRFLSLDPIGFSSGDFNFYRYVGNDPVNLMDPDGKTPVHVAMALAAAFAKSYNKLKGYSVSINHARANHSWGYYWKTTTVTKTDRCGRTHTKTKRSRKKCFKKHLEVKVFNKGRYVTHVQIPYGSCGDRQ
jgi:RHS repeat-associated protein